MAGGGKTRFNNAKFFPVGPGQAGELVETLEGPVHHQ